MKTIYKWSVAVLAGVALGAVARNNAPDLFLTRTLQYAALVRGDTNDAALELLTSGRADALAGAQAGHLAIMESRAGYRMLDADFLVVPHSLAMQPARATGLAYAARFIEAAKASGLVLRSIEASGLRGVRVAPPSGG
jgi:hypothetical protein